MITRNSRRCGCEGTGVIKTAIVLLTMVAIAASIICSTSHAYAYDSTSNKSYSWNDVYQGVLGIRPIINCISGEQDFLSAKEAVNGSNYSKTDVAIKKEKAFWLLAEVHNDNPNDWVTAEDVRLKLSIRQTAKNACTVTGELFSSNAEPYYVKDTISFTAKEPFHLEYDIGSSYIYSWANDVSKTMNAKGDAVSDSGILLGNTQIDGKIPGGAYVSSSVTLKVVRDSDKARLRTTAKGKATVKMWNLIQNYSDPHYFTGKYHSKVVSYSDTGKLSGKKYKTVAAVARNETSGCKSDYEKIKRLCEYIGKRVYYDSPCHLRKTNTTYYNAYDVWKNKRSVCQGYANLYWTMLDSLGIPCMMVYGDNHVFNAAYDKSSRRWIFVDVAWCSGNVYNGKGKWEQGTYKKNYFDMSLDYLLTLSSHEIYGVEGVLRDNVYYELTPGYDNGRDAGFKNMAGWHWSAVCQKKKKSTLKFVSRIDQFDVKEIGESAFFGRPDIKKIYLPTTITTIGRYAFCLKNNRHKVKTKVITKLPKSALKLKKGYRWWSRSVKVKRR